MIVAKRANSHSLIRLSSQIRRCFASSHADSKPTVIKVNFSELPKGHILPDGTLASPIGEWLGGLERDSNDVENLKTTQSRRPKKAAANSEVIDVVVNSSRKATPKRRSKQAENDLETINGYPKQTGRGRQCVAEIRSEGMDSVKKSARMTSVKGGILLISILNNH